MMDEVDLQLCLDIDPMIQNPRLRLGKRSAPELASDAVSHSDTGKSKNDTLTSASLLTSIRSSYTQHNEDHTLGNDARHQDRGQGPNPGLYLARPPRKRVRTLRLVPALERKGMLQFEDPADHVAEGSSELDVTSSVDGDRDEDGCDVSNLRRTSLLSSLEALHGVSEAHPLENRIVSPAPGPSTGMDVDIDMGVDNSEHKIGYENDNTIAPDFQTRDLMYTRHQASFILFSDDPYVPAVSKTRLSRGTSSGRTPRFVIYEDTDDMMLDMHMDVGIDGGGEGTWIQPGWYLSPEENKENTEVGNEEQNHIQYEDGHVHGSGGDLAFSGTESYV